MLRSLLALSALPVAHAAAAVLGASCATAGTTCSTNASCTTEGANKICRCDKNKVATGTDTCAATATAKISAAVVACDATDFAKGHSVNTVDGDVFANAQCLAGGVLCKANFWLKAAGIGCTSKDDVLLGTEMANGNSTPSKAVGAKWDIDDLTAKNMALSATYLDCAANSYATDNKTCAANTGMRLGGACYLHARATKNAASIAAKKMRCMIAADATAGAGKLACLATHIDDKSDSADACVAPKFKGACDSATAGTPATTTTATANTYALPSGYTCPKVAVAAVAGTSEAQAKDKLACAATHVPCQGAEGSTDVTCETKTACDAKTTIRLGGYCSVDANCTKDAAGTAVVTTNTGKCRVSETGAKVCSCVKGLKQNGSNCLGADTINNALAATNVCYNGTASINGVTLKSLQVFGTGMTCSGAADAGVIACDATSSFDATTGGLKLGYMLNAAGTGCSQWNGDISKAQACKTDVDYTAFAANAECKGATMGCPATGNTTICAMNKAMCGKKPTDSVKSECKCPYAMHKAAKSDDPDFDDKACIATIVGATCSVVPAETFPASNPSTSYACTSNKIACATTHLECKNAGPMKGRCIAKALISGTVADQTAANLAKAYKVCPTTKAPTTAAPSAASGLAIPALAALVAIAFA